MNRYCSLFGSFGTCVLLLGSMMGSVSCKSVREKLAGPYEFTVASPPTRISSAWLIVGPEDPVKDIPAKAAQADPSFLTATAQADYADYVFLEPDGEGAWQIEIAKDTTKSALSLVQEVTTGKDGSAEFVLSRKFNASDMLLVVVAKFAPPLGWHAITILPAEASGLGDGRIDFGSETVQFTPGD